MNAVDTGWVTDEDLAEMSKKKQEVMIFGLRWILLMVPPKLWIHYLMELTLEDIGVENF